MRRVLCMCEREAASVCKVVVYQSVLFNIWLLEWLCQWTARHISTNSRAAEMQVSVIFTHRTFGSVLDSMQTCAHKGTRTLGQGNVRCVWPTLNLYQRLLKLSSTGSFSHAPFICKLRLMSSVSIELPLKITPIPRQSQSLWFPHWFFSPSPPRLGFSTINHISDEAITSAR